MYRLQWNCKERQHVANPFKIRKSSKSNKIKNYPQIIELLKQKVDKRSEKPPNDQKIEPKITIENNLINETIEIKPKQEIPTDTIENHTETPNNLIDNSNVKIVKNEIIDIFEGNKEEVENPIPKVSYIIL